MQLDHGEEMGPMHGMYGTLNAELGVQRTIRRAELTAFLCLFRKAIGLTMVHVNNRGIIDGLWRGEMGCSGPGAKDADLWILIWEELHGVRQEGILVEVEHVKAHRSKKEMQHMSHFQRFITEGNAKADECAKEGAMLDGGLGAQVRAITIQQEREEVHAALQCTASFQWVWWRNEKMVKSLDQSQKRSGLLKAKKSGSKEVSHGVVCGSNRISVCEVRMKQQTDANARTMWRTKVVA